MIRSAFRSVMAVSMLLGMAFLTPADPQHSKSKIPADLIKQLIADINDNKNGYRLSKADLQILHKQLRYERHDLNGDGVREFFLYINHFDWCGAGSNCSYWVYQRTAAGYKLLLEEKVLRVQNKRTNGFRDLASETPMGFCARNVQRLFVTMYHYDGKTYREGQFKVDCRE